MHVQVQYILLLQHTRMNLPVPLLFIPHILNESTDTVSYAVGDQNFLGRRKGSKSGHENFVNNQYNL